MLDYIMGNTVFIKAIAVCCIIGIISWTVQTISYISMIRSSSNIGHTKKKWLVSLKQRYEDYRNMDVKVNNVSTYVDRLFRKKRICGLTCNIWSTISYLCIGGCAIAGALGALVYSQQGVGLHEIIIVYLAGTTAALSLIMLEILLQPEKRKNRILVNMEDYLENVLENSMQGKRAVGELQEERRQRRMLNYAKENCEKKKAFTKVTKEEEKLLEDVLQEFFA